LTPFIAIVPHAACHRAQVATASLALRRAASATPDTCVPLALSSRAPSPAYATPVPTRTLAPRHATPAARATRAASAPARRSRRRDCAVPGRSRPQGRLRVCSAPAARTAKPLALTCRRRVRWAAGVASAPRQPRSVTAGSGAHLVLRMAPACRAARASRLVRLRM
jgi:hypothetical protein